MRNIDKKIKLWNTRTGELQTTLGENEQGLTHPVSTVQFSSDGATLISGSRDGTVRMWDLETGENSTPFGKTEYGEFLLLPVLPDSTTLASVSRENTIRLWDTKTRETHLTLAGHTTSITSIALSVDGVTLASANDNDSTIQLWDLQTRRRKAILEGHQSPVSYISFSPDGLTLTSGDSHGRDFLWDVQTQQHKDTFTRNSGGIVAFSHDKHTFASVSGPSIRLWDAHTGARKMTIWGHTGYVTSVAFSPDSATLASGSKPPNSSENPGAMIRLWDTKTGNQRLAFIGGEHSVDSVAFSTDGETLVSTSGAIIRLWDVKTGKRKATLTTYPEDARHRVYTRSVAFSPDGRTFVSGDEGDEYNRKNYNRIRVFDVETGKHLDTLTGHTGGVKSLAYSDDGMTLASGSADGTTLLWKMASAPAARLRITPLSVEAPPSGEQLTFNINMAGSQNVTGYQLTLQYDATALRYISSTSGAEIIKSLPAMPPVLKENSVTFAESTAAGSRIEDGTLVTVTFEVLKRTDVTLMISEALLTHNTRERSQPLVSRAWVTEPPRIPEDVNHDWHLDAADLEAVSSHLGQTGKGHRADVNGDGVVDIADLVFVTKALYAPTPAPPKD